MATRLLIINKSLDDNRGAVTILKIMKYLSSLAAMLLASLLVPQYAQALPTYTETDSSSGSSSFFDGNIQNNDLIEGLTASSNVTGGDGGTPLSALNDGLASDASVGSNTNDLWFNNGGGVYGAYSATLPLNPVLTYTLPTTPLGYTITSINSIFGYGGGYADAAMANQNFSISYSTVAAPAVFLSLGTVSYDPFGDYLAGAGGSSTQVNLTSILGVTGVADLRFAFTNNGDSAGEIIREIDVNGIADVPEPSTYAMMLGGLALLGFCVRRKLA
jgi:hypothetical protein